MTDAVTIRKVRGTHPALRQLHTETLPGDLHPDYHKGWWWVAFKAGIAVAFAGIEPSRRWRNTLYMVRCGVLDKARGKGLQKRLIRVRLALARALGMNWVITTTYDNPASANSLISCGFRLYEPSEPWAAPGTLYWRLKLNQET